MKRLIITTIICLLLFSSVYAGSIYNAEYYDRNTFWGSRAGGTIRTMNDQDVIINADTIDGYSANDLRWSGTVAVDCASLQYITYMITGDYEWMHKYVYGYSIYDQLSERYATLLMLEKTNNRLDIIEARLNAGDDYGMELARIKAKRLNRNVKLGNYSCYPNGVCLS